jgi:pimeloyl-ACP methyl ester carboxylesterase
MREQECEVTTPHADEVLVLADGRRLAWAEWGDPRGAPLVFFHPSPGSRMLCPDPSATTAAGIRLISVDRPGYGRSDPVADPSLASFIRDLERLLDHLWIGQVPVVGWSGGGQYAAASAAILAERVSGVALVATPAADDQLRWLTPEFRKLAELAAEGSGRALTSFGDHTLLRPEAKRGLMEMWKESGRTGTAGLSADVVAASRPWGFAPADVRVRAALFYGEKDSVIDAEHCRWWARALAEVDVTIVARSDHFVVFTAWPDILNAVT